MFGSKKIVGAEAPPDLSAGLARALRRAPVAPTERTAQPSRAALDYIDAALTAVSRASRIVTEAAETLIEAAGEPDAAARAMLAERYDDVRCKVDALTEAGGEMGALTVPGAEPLSVPLSRAVYVVSPFALGSDETGLNLPPPKEGFETHAEVAEVLRRVEAAMESLARARMSFSRDREFLSGEAARRAA